MRRDWVALALLACAAATLFHHVHNAAFLHRYPNMPAWISPGAVYAAWLAGTATGAIGYRFLRSGYRVAGVIVLAAYALYALDGLAHYALAPMSAHTIAMNLTIWLEAAAGLGLLAALAAPALSSGRPSP